MDPHLERYQAKSLIGRHLIETFLRSLVLNPDLEFLPFFHEIPISNGLNLAQQNQERFFD